MPSPFSDAQAGKHRDIVYKRCQWNQKHKKSVQFAEIDDPQY